MKETSFENSLKELEKIVSQLEEGKLTLEQSLRAFERGVQLTAFCQKRLSEAEQKVELLMKGDEGKPVTEPFEVEQ